MMNLNDVDRLRMKIADSNQRALMELAISPQNFFANPEIVSLQEKIWNDQRVPIGGFER